MTQIVGYGPLVRVDGPPPIEQPYGLLQAADQPAAGVRVVPEGDEYWINGVEVYPYPTHAGDTFDPCAPASEEVEKDEGDDLPHPQFAAMVAYVPTTCSSQTMGTTEQMKARAAEVMGAVGGAIAAHEFLTGLRYLNNPHLSDGNGTFPNGDVPTGIIDALSILENEIALSRRGGLIHMSPGAADKIGSTGGLALDSTTGVLRTRVGTVVIADYGYAGGATPSDGHADPTSTEEWIYASGPIDIRKSKPFTVPDDIKEALDREHNIVTFRSEQYFLVDWDTAVQAAVLADLCDSSCARQT